MGNTIEEMNEVLQNYCDGDCDKCGIDDLCHSIKGDFISHEDVCKEAYARITELSETKPTNVQKHMEIATELNQLYERKNKDYGDSFHISFLEEGMAMARIRLGDKLNRFKTLTKSDQQMVTDESIRDTLIDLANYAIMTVMELDRKD